MPRGHGFEVTTEDSKVGVIAANAPNGGLRMNEPGNALTAAFAQNSDDAIQIAAAFKRFAPRSSGRTSSTLCGPRRTRCSCGRSRRRRKR